MQNNNEAHHVDDQDTEVNNNSPFLNDYQSTEESNEFYAMEETLEMNVNSHND
jgi:hypothetical protein